MRAMGADMEVTKRTSDGGIDGEGAVTVGLISFKVVMQAKRYNPSNKVNEKELRDFLGAIAKARAEKAMFITTSTFAPAATEVAKDHSITLIDGVKLLKLMKENDVFYSKKLNLSI